MPKTRSQESTSRNSKNAETLTWNKAANRLEECIRAAMQCAEALPARDPRLSDVFTAETIFLEELRDIIAAGLRRNNGKYKLRTDEIKQSAATLKATSNAVSEMAKNVDNARRVIGFLGKIIGLTGR